MTGTGSGNRWTGTGSGRRDDRSPLPDHPLEPVRLLLLVQDQLRAHLCGDAAVVPAPLALPSVPDGDVTLLVVSTDEALVLIVLLRSPEIFD